MGGMTDTHRAPGLRGAVEEPCGGIERGNLQITFCRGSFIARPLSDDDSSGLEACHDGHLKNNDI